MPKLNFDVIKCPLFFGTVCPKQFALWPFFKNQWSDCQNSKRNAFLYAKTHIWPVPKLKGHQGHRGLKKRPNTGFLDLSFEPLVQFCWNFGTKHISGVKFLTMKILHEVAWFLIKVGGDWPDFISHGFARQERQYGPKNEFWHQNICTL